MHELEALSPIDGRYAKFTQALSPYLSEAAFFSYRARLEIEYLLALIELPLPALENFPREYFSPLRQLSHPLSLQDLQEIKALEKETRHDVKALEYFLRNRIHAVLPPEWHFVTSFLHFGLTSQDINNTALPLMEKEALENVYFPALEKFMGWLHEFAWAHRKLVMLSFTHGQPAVPTTLGKEIYVFFQRLKEEYTTLQKIPFWAKWGGAVGNLNAHVYAYPEIDWQVFFDAFLRKRGLRRFPLTTQIAPYERWAERWDSLRRIQTILIDYAQDIWLYMSRGYLALQKPPSQIGSSTMPHKTNPIDFELAEGNLYLSNRLWSFLAEKLPISRLQRDLTDSTLLRNIGVALGHGYVALTSLYEGSTQIHPQPHTITHELQAHPEILSEAWQTLLRKNKDPHAYEKVKNLLDQGLPLPAMPPLTFEEYIGYAAQLVPPPTSLEPETPHDDFSAGPQG
ncbi:MAG: adenylosuccinate lyase [Bacteroidia bacterium]